MEKIKNQLQTIRIDAKFPNGLTEPYSYTPEDIILATAKVGVDYMQLWSSVTNENKTKDEYGHSSIKGKHSNEITTQKFKNLLHTHKTLYKNKIYEASDVSNILFKAAILNMA